MIKDNCAFRKMINLKLSSEECKRCIDIYEKCKESNKNNFESKIASLAILLK